MKNKVKDFLGVALVTLTAVFGIFVTSTPVVKADTVGVTVKVVPAKGKNIFGRREDYPVVKSRIILNGTHLVILAQWEVEIVGILQLMYLGLVEIEL